MCAAIHRYHIKTKFFLLTILFLLFQLFSFGCEFMIWWVFCQVSVWTSKLCNFSFFVYWTSSVGNYKLMSVNFPLFWIIFWVIHLICKVSKCCCNITVSWITIPIDPIPERKRWTRKGEDGWPTVAANIPGYDRSSSLCENPFSSEEKAEDKRRYTYVFSLF